MGSQSCTRLSDWTTTYIFVISVLFHKNYSNIFLLNLCPLLLLPICLRWTDFISPHSWLWLQSEPRKKSLIRSQDQTKSMVSFQMMAHEWHVIGVMGLPADLSKSQLNVYITFSLTQASCGKNLRIFSIENTCDNVWFQNKTVIPNSRGME